MGVVGLSTFCERALHGTPICSIPQSSFGSSSSSHIRPISVAVDGNGLLYYLMDIFCFDWILSSSFAQFHDDVCSYIRCLAHCHDLHFDVVVFDGCSDDAKSSTRIKRRKKSCQFVQKVMTTNNAHDHSTLRTPSFPSCYIGGNTKDYVESLSRRRTATHKASTISATTAAATGKGRAGGDTDHLHTPRDSRALSSLHRYARIPPPMIMAVLRSALRRCGVPMVQCIGEADPVLADIVVASQASLDSSVSGQSQSPRIPSSSSTWRRHFMPHRPLTAVMGLDSDFMIYNTPGYIPFSSLQYIDCDHHHQQQQQQQQQEPNQQQQQQQHPVHHSLLHDRHLSASICTAGSLSHHLGLPPPATLHLLPLLAVLIGNDITKDHVTKLSLHRHLLSMVRSSSSSSSPPSSSPSSPISSSSSTIHLFRPFAMLLRNIGKEHPILRPLIDRGETPTETFGGGGSNGGNDGASGSTSLIADGFSRVASTADAPPTIDGGGVRAVDFAQTHALAYRYILEQIFARLFKGGASSTGGGATGRGTSSKSQKRRNRRKKAAGGGGGRHSGSSNEGTPRIQQCSTAQTVVTIFLDAALGYLIADGNCIDGEGDTDGESSSNTTTTTTTITTTITGGAPLLHPCVEFDAMFHAGHIDPSLYALAHARTYWGDVIMDHVSDRGDDDNDDDGGGPSDYGGATRPIRKRILAVLAAGRVVKGDNNRGRDGSCDCNGDDDEGSSSSDGCSDEAQDVDATFDYLELVQSSSNYVRRQCGIAIPAGRATCSPPSSSSPTSSSSSPSPSGLDNLLCIWKCHSSPLGQRWFGPMAPVPTDNCCDPLQGVGLRERLLCISSVVRTLFRLPIPPCPHLRTTHNTRFHEWEVDALVLHAVCLCVRHEVGSHSAIVGDDGSGDDIGAFALASSLHSSSATGDVPVTWRGHRMACMYQLLIHHFLMSNQACGLPLPHLSRHPSLLFDGHLFHAVYDMVAAGVFDSSTAAATAPSSSPSPNIDVKSPDTDRVFRVLEHACSAVLPSSFLSSPSYASSSPPSLSTSTFSSSSPSPLSSPSASLIAMYATVVVKNSLDPSLSRPELARHTASIWPLENQPADSLSRSLSSVSPDSQVPSPSLPLSPSQPTERCVRVQRYEDHFVPFGIGR